MALNVTLVVVGGDVKTPEVKLRLPSTVGRGRDCSIMLRHPLVSRQHCEIFEASGELLVRDLGSLNGTFVNNQRIEGDAPLQPGQLLTVGTVTFRAMYEAGGGDSAPPTTPSPKMKTPAPSNETDMDGTLSARPTRGTHATKLAGHESDTEEPDEPVEDAMDFDLDDAQPLFSDAPIVTKEPSPPPKKPTGSAETVYAGNKSKPPVAPDTTTKPNVPPKPAAPVAPKPDAPKPTAAKPPPEKPAAPAAAPAKPKAEEPVFNFLDPDEEPAGGDEDDDDLSDFLKNLK